MLSHYLRLVEDQARNDSISRRLGHSRPFSEGTSHRLVIDTLGLLIVRDFAQIVQFHVVYLAIGWAQNTKSSRRRLVQVLNAIVTLPQHALL